MREGERPQYILVDGNSIAYRAFFALPQSIQARDGSVANAVYGFVSMVIRLIGELMPVAIVVAFDSPWPTRRHSVFPAYKGARSPLPEVLLKQVPMLQFLGRVGIPWLASEGWEADDILATVAFRHSSEDATVRIVSGDRDMFQLVELANIAVLYPRRGVTKYDTINAVSLKASYGIEARRFVEFRALVGDTSDNLPGVRGVGEKSAVRIIDGVPDLASAIASGEWGALEAGMVGRLEAHAEIILRNLAMMRLEVQAPVDPAIAALARLQPEAFMEMGFDTLLERYDRMMSTETRSRLS